MSQTTTSKRPLTVLQKNTKKDVIVTLKSGVEYRGKMENVDSYMNLIMTDAEELNQFVLTNGKKLYFYIRISN